MAAQAPEKFSTSADIRAHLSHPIIDSDGHTFEIEGAFLDALRDLGGTSLVEAFGRAIRGSFLDPDWSSLSMDERRRRCFTRPTWRAIPTRNTRDLATALMPHLLYDRLDEMGLDVSVVYPTMGLVLTEIEVDEVRRGACRALNRLRAEMFREFSDRLIPVATIPMHTPQEAIEELRYSTGELGYRAGMMASFVRRPIAAAVAESAAVGQYAYWMDSFGIDSEYDYDPVWAACAELGISPTFHSRGYGWGTRQSFTNYTFNHIGSFAASAEAVCRSLLMGGVPKRFPNLTFAFLEGGITWACALFADLIGHFRKRNLGALENYNPARIDRALFSELANRYGGKFAAGRAEQVIDRFVARSMAAEDPALLDEWAPSQIGSAEEIRDIFRSQFYFGCEGDDPLNALAFGSRMMPFNSRLNALYGSDIGHWDVPDMRQVGHEAYELTEDGIITADDFRDFVFVNPIGLWTRTNRDFFKGTVVEREVAAIAQAESASAGTDLSPRA
ncbi:MAG TPA: amidohydrolase family protein [Candidatus Binataceae bacterium]|nr:amidohydrolase family protein [Candidatus Binataceae bacterium]